MGRNNKYIVLWNVMKREFRRLVSRPLYLFCMVIAPLFCYIFFTTLMDSGLPTDMPVGVVDQDMTATSRQLVRNLDAFEQTAVVAHYPNIADARIAMQANWHRVLPHVLHYMPRELRKSRPWHFCNRLSSTLTR